MAVVDLLRCRTSRDPLLMHLLRCLVFYASTYIFDFMAVHIPGVHNTAADALSRNNLTLFSSLFFHRSLCYPPAGCRGLASSEQTGLGVTDMDRFVQELFDEGISRATHAVYRSGWSHYVNFCAKLSQPPLPLVEHTVCQFAAFMSKSVSWKTIRVYLSALRFFQIRTGLPDPSFSSFPRLTYTLKGIHRTKPDHPSRQRLPITLIILRQLHTIWSKPPIVFNNIMLWAACCLGFFGFLRAGEFTCITNNTTAYPLMVSDVSVDARSNPQLLTVRLRFSKTDPFGAGCSIYLGRTNTIPCPVAAVLSYLALRPPTPGPLFVFQNGVPLTRVTFVKQLRDALRAAGIDSSRYAGHSFRIGAATAAAHAGYSDSSIQTLGRWRSAAFISYIRTSPSALASVASTLVTRCS